MAGEFLLNTSAVIAIFAGAPEIGQVIVEQKELTDGDGVC